MAVINNYHVDKNTLIVYGPSFPIIQKAVGKLPSESMVESGIEGVKLYKVGDEFVNLRAGDGRAFIWEDYEKVMKKLGIRLPYYEHHQHFSGNVGDTILFSLAKGHMTIEQISEDTGISYTTIRKHLLGLERLGTVKKSGFKKFTWSLAEQKP